MNAHKCSSDAQDLRSTGASPREASHGYYLASGQRAIGCHPWKYSLQTRNHAHAHKLEHSILSHHLGRFSLAGHRCRRILLRLNGSSSYHPWMPARRPCKRTTVCYAHSYACGFVGDAVEKLATGPEELNISLYDLKSSCGIPCLVAFLNTRLP